MTFVAYRLEQICSLALIDTTATLIIPKSLVHLADVELPSVRTD